jgi:hypothetical protein
LEVITAGKRSKTGRRLAIIGGGLVVLLIIGYVTLRMTAPGLSSTLLEKTLHVPVHIGRLELSFTANTITIADIRLDQPESFEPQPILSIDKVEVVGWTGLIFGPRHLAEVRVTGVGVNILTDGDGRINLQTLFEPQSNEIKEPIAMMAMKIDRIIIDSITAVSKDYSVKEDGFTFTLEAGSLEVIDLTLGSYPDPSDGSVQFQAELVQAETDSAHLMFAARFGPIAESNPPVLGSVGMIGALYQTFVPAVPAGTDLLLGGEGFDLNLDMALADDRILAVGGATTSNGSTYPFRVSGSVDEPVIELPGKLASVAARMTGGVGRLLNSTLTSGKEILVGAIDTAASFGEGALHATGSFLKGVSRMSAGVVAGNQDARKKGFDEITSEAGDHFSGAFTGSADAIGKAGSRTSDALINDPAMRAWIEAIPVRKEEWIKSRHEELYQAPFPYNFTDPAKDSKDFD